MEVANLKIKYSLYEPHIDDIVFFLKSKLADALANKVTSEATKLQEQIWTLKDYKVGHVKKENQKHLEEVFDIFEKFMKKPKLTQSDIDSKKLKNLKRKRDQIQKLIEKQAKGEKLEQNQIDKIKTLADIEDEIADLE